MFALIPPAGLIFPVLLDLEAPLPLQMYVFVVVGEERVDCVGAAGHQTRWGIL